MREIIVVGFAGGGGSCTGIKQALGRSPDFAINHDEIALGMHAVNHPETVHIRTNIWRVDPNDVGPGRRIALGWFSPDCTDHSKAKGGMPVRRHIRDLGWVPVLWAQRRRPRVIMLENVEEFADWSPIIDGRRDPQRKGETFKRFVRALEREGYRVEWQLLRACDYGAPTIRRRLYLIARCDGERIVWPQPTHGAGRPLPYRAAADIIDWSLPCPSIFMTPEECRAWRERTGTRVNRPLAEATMARIARGVRRYVLEAAEPFVVRIDQASGDPARKGVHSADEPVRTIATAGSFALTTPFLAPITHTGDPRVHNVGEPLRTITTAHRGEHALVAAHLAKFQENGSGSATDEPLHTVMAGAGRHALVAAFLAQHNYEEPGHDAREPVSTIVTKGCTQAVVSAGLVSLHGADRRQSPPDAPTPTITASGWHLAEVRAFLIKYFGTADGQDLGEPLHTVTGKPRFGLVLVLVHGEPYQIVDIGMRMLTPRELALAQGCPPDYVIDRMADGRAITKTNQIRMIGNMVCPPVAEALVRANVELRDIAPVVPEEFRLEAAE